MRTGNEYREFLTRVRELYTLEQVAGLLSWDEQTYMPPGSYQDRAKQKAAIAGIYHERLTSRGMGRLIRALKKQELSPDGEVILREVARKWQRASSIPGELVREISRTESLALDAWMKARKDNDYKVFEPWLTRTIGLKARAAEHIGYEDRPYDALLDEFEPGTKARDVEALFSRLRSKLLPVAKKILDEPEMTDALPATTYPADEQLKFCTAVCRDMGYDLDCGRIDLSTHPFTSGSGMDVRITVRYQEDSPIYSIFPTIHEAGHALYEQGFREKYYFTPLAEAVSHGVHESQSRLWENMVGRSPPFWSCYYPRLQRSFPALKELPLDVFVRSVNAVRRSYVRVEADEVTYNLHIMLRYDAEAALFEGKLKAGEIPAFWNERFERYLGLAVPDDLRGCLQDIHWAGGSFGYFPSYTMGNIYAAQLWDAARRQVPDLEGRIASGDLGALLAWLRRNVHRHGKRYGAAELIQRVTGSGVSEDYFIRYLKEKYGGLYGIAAWVPRPRALMPLAPVISSRGPGR